MNVWIYFSYFLIFFVRHQRFERKNNDLYTNLSITLQDALNGFDISFPHLDGHNVRKF
jgi:DnaJ family protein B protein 11